MSAIAAARELLARGWSPVPVPRGRKKPLLKNWTLFRASPDELPTHFADDSNVGILTGQASGQLVDIDLDCDEAVELAAHLLPETPMRSGRPTRPRSHAWYVLTGSLPASRTFKDVDAGRTTLVEFRGDGRQTLVAPSTHPDGDKYRWEGPLDPAEAQGTDLFRSVSRLAAACLLARRWPRTNGSRHEIANALAGFLVRAGWCGDDIGAFVKSVAAAAGDEEIRDRVSTALDTVRRFRAGRSVTGGKTLADLLGSAVVDRIGEWLGLVRDTAFTASTAYADLPSRSWPEPLEEAAMHGLAGRIVDVLEPHTEADPAAILVQFLAAFGNCVGRGPHFRVESDNHHTNLFVGIVGATSKGRKGTSWGRVRGLFTIVDPDWAHARIVNGLSSGEGLIWHVRDPIKGLNHVKVKGRIVESEEIVTDPGVDDKRLLVVESELASALRVIAREGNTLSATVRSAWETGRLQTLTKNSPAVATNAHISIIGHISKDEIARELDRTEVANGFANRFLWVAARRSKLLPDGGSLADANLAFVHDQLKRVITSARQLQRFERDPNARSLWHEVYGPLSDGKPGLFGAVVSRAEAQVTRLSLLYALLDESPVVTRVHLEAALAIWRYSEDSARYIFGDSLGDPVADTVLRALRETPAGLTRNEIREMFGRNRPAEQISRALRSLQDANLVHFSMEPTDGRPAERWIAGPGYAIDAVNAVRGGGEGAYGVNGVPGDADSVSTGDDDEVVL